MMYFLQQNARLAFTLENCLLKYRNIYIHINIFCGPAYAWVLVFTVGAGLEHCVIIFYLQKTGTQLQKLRKAMRILAVVDFYFCFFHYFVLQNNDQNNTSLTT